MDSSCQLRVVGLGTRGHNQTRKLAHNGFTVAAFSHVREEVDEPAGARFHHDWPEDPGPVAG